MTKKTSWIGAILVTSSTAVAGCATAPPPPELVSARAAYIRAENSHAKRLDPAALHEAAVALKHAEAAYRDDDEAPETRDMAYLAERKAQYAEAQASTMNWKQREDVANQKADSARDNAAQNQLQQTRGELDKTRAELEKSESRARDAMSRLAMANTAQVKEEPRGTVITLSGAVLFASGKSALLPGAQTRLDEVATALKDQEDKNILIEGHTDSRGTDTKNQELSKGRADAVGQYLVSKGVPAARVTTAGLGASRPIADNESAEGRANNRRVEIVVQAGEPK